MSPPKMNFVDLNFETFIKNHLSKKLKDRIAKKHFLISAVSTLSLERLNWRFKIFTTLVKPKMLTLHFLIPQRLKLNLFWQKSYISSSLWEALIWTDSDALKVSRQICAVNLLREWHCWKGPSTINWPIFMNLSYISFDKIHTFIIKALLLQALLSKPNPLT